jgi:hypothetical protein
MSFLLACLMAPSVLGQPVSGRSAAEEARRVLASFGHEPTILEVQSEAARHGLVDASAYESWRSQTAWANLLPERLNGEYYYLDRDETDVRTTQSTQSVSQTISVDDHARYKAVVEWDLSKLIFNSDTLQASRETSRLVERREDLLTTVNKLYFARRQLQAELVLKPIENTKTLIRTHLRLASLTADLDALTGGWFSRKVTARTSDARRPGASPVRPGAAAR